MPQSFPNLLKYTDQPKGGAYACDKEWFLAKGREVPHGPEIPGAGRRRPARLPDLPGARRRTRQRTRRLDARRTGTACDQRQAEHQAKIQVKIHGSLIPCHFLKEPLLVLHVSPIG